MRSLILLTLISIGSSFATTFIPVPIERQLKEAAGVIFAKFQGQSYKKTSDGEVITVGSFEVLKSIGVRNSDIINKNNFQVLYPGGKWQGLVHKVYGSPTFVNQELVVLILNKSKQGYYVKGLNMGKYNTFVEDGKTYLKNAVFPTHLKLGRISLAKFELELETRFGGTFSKVNSDKYVFNKEEKIKKEIAENRAPASALNGNNKLVDEEKNEISIVWLVFIFSVLGAYSIHRSKKRS